VSEKQNDKKKLIEKMRANRDKQNRKTEALPWRRSRIKMQKGRPTDGSEKQK
jgi:protein tyrosine phosphatase